MEHNARSGYRNVAICIWLFVAVALVLQNVLVRGPSIQIEESHDEVWRGEIFRWGWPLSFAQHIEAELLEARLRGNVTSTTKTTFPSWALNDSYTCAALANVGFGALLLAATAFVLNHWRREEKRRLQFGLRTMLVATTIVAALLSLITQNAIDWSLLLSLPLAFGVICIPTAIGILMAKGTKRKPTR